MSRIVGTNDSTKWFSPARALQDLERAGRDFDIDLGGHRNGLLIR